jgi:tRNA threonylcarbamoyladenosine biosynthesis protein TsaB
MLLALDTATRWASIALYNDTGILSEFSWRCRGNHTVEMLPAVALMMKQARSQPSDLKAVAIAQGPGSFTGLRIGMGIAKGLCLALDIPIIAIPTLDIMAYEVGDPGGLVYTVIELGRGRICVSCYRYENGLPVLHQDAAIHETSEWQVDALEPVVVTGEISAELADRLLKQPNAENIAISSFAASARRAGYLAELAWQRLGDGQVNVLDTIDPIYLHLPGSEIRAV